jgi:two-component system, sensor histidine kinase and response regulator
MQEAAKASILIVDDVAENIQVAANVLKHEGYRMAFATSGQRALELCRANAYDLILLDVMMPELDGFAVCRALRSEPATARVPVIFLTAKTEPEDIVQGFDAGGTDYVTKPFNGPELLARVRTHLGLWRSELELRQMNAEKDRFLTLISQELKRPFVGLKGVLEMTVEQFDELERPALYEYLSLAYQASDNLGKLLDNLIRWADVQTKTIPAFPRELDLGSEVEAVVDALGELLHAKSIRLEVAVPVGTFVVADRDMVATILRNLLTNAIMFSHPGGEVRVTAREEGGEVEVTVADRGIGIAPQDQQKLFRVDGRFQAKGTRGEIGTGIGLILCRDLATQNRGRIWLDSEPGAGTQVHVTLPRPQGA